MDLVGFPWDGVSLATLVSFGVLSVWRGWLVPKAQCKAMVDLLSRQIETQTETIRVVDARNDRLAEQVRILAEAAKTTNAVVSALPTPEGDHR